MVQYCLTFSINHPHFLVAYGVVFPTITDTICSEFHSSLTQKLVLSMLKSNLFSYKLSTLYLSGMVDWLGWLPILLLDPEDHMTWSNTWLRCHLSPDSAPVAQPPPSQSPPPHHNPQPRQCTQPFTQGYFLAFSLIGQEGTQKYWLDQKLAYLQIPADGQQMDLW
jgi:hypothetical protein